MEAISDVVTAPEKPVSVEDEKTVESNKQVAEEQQEATFAIKTCENVEKGTDKANETVQVKETVVENDNETSSITSEEIVEEEEENEDDSAEQKVTEKVLSDGSQTSTTTTVITEHSNPNGTITTETITKKILKEEPQTRSVHSITTTPPTPTTDETKTMNFETKPEVSPKDHVEEESDEEEVDEVEMKEKIATERIHQQQVQKDQTIHEADPIKDVTDAPSLRSNTNEPKSEIVSKQGNLNNTIKDIISSIDSNIIAEENMAALKQIDLELLKKQQELAMEIQQQQFLAQKLANENRLLQQQQKELQLSNKKTETIFSQKEQPITNELKYSTFDETQDGNNYSRRSQTMETRESTNVSKKIDLQKIFSPAADAEEILPKNRKLYASSAFYSPTLHPTVEDQVELARKISHSLSDITNHQSKGQSMYVNRKKRSVKWVHEGCGQDYHQYQQQSKPSTSPSILPAFTDAAKHRVQLNMHQEQLLEKYAKPGIKVVKTPWEAALESGSANAAFVEDQKLSSYQTPARSPAPQYLDARQGGQSYEPISNATDRYNKPGSADGFKEYAPQQIQQQYKLNLVQNERRQAAGTNPQRDLAYKPSIPQGWKAPNMSLPADLYVPKEIPLQSYAPPPVAAQDSINISHDYFEPAWKSSNTHQHTYQPLATTALTAPLGGSGSFPITKPLQMGFATSCGNNQPPKQQYLTPESYQTVSQMAAQTVPQLNFSPSPLPYNKLAKFENSTNDTLNSEYRRVYSSPRSTAHLGSKDHNTSPDPFLGSYQHKPHTPSLENSSHVSTPRLSPRPPSSLNHFSGNNARIPQTTFNSILLLNAPSYNSSARGWQCSVPSTGYQAPQRGPMNAHKPECSVLMPYTDF